MITKKTNIREDIEAILEKRRKIYLTDPLLIVQDYNGEQKMVSEYDGRQLLEMLQNANDACITKSKQECYIELTNDTLIIANNGTGFTQRGIEALTYMDLSEKKDDDEAIGAKGLGFRSILSWAKSVIIKSNDEVFEFSREHSITFLKRLIQEKPEIEEKLREIAPKEPYPIATLRCPQLIDLKNEYTTYDTYIIIKLKENFDLQKIEKQINEELNLEVLLFLNHLKTIKVCTPLSRFILQKQENTSKVIISRKDLDSCSVIEEKQWTVLKECGQIEERRFELKVAWEDEPKSGRRTLYSYFKTEVELDFPCLIHGTFDLTSNRNHFVSESSYNKKLVDKLISLLIKSARTIAKTDVSYKPLQILNINEKHVDPFWRNCDFIPKLREKIKLSPIFPVNQNRYITFSDNPRYLSNHDYSHVLPVEHFNNLLKHTEDKSIIRFLNKLGVPHYEWIDLFEKISVISNDLCLNDRLTLLQYIYEDFSSQKDITTRPSLLIDEEGEVIPSETDTFWRPNKEHSLPIDSSIKLVNNQLVENLGEKCLHWYGVKEYTLSVAFNRLKKHYEEDLERTNKKPTKRKEVVKSFINTLYKIYSSENSEFLKEHIDPEKILIINRNEKIVPLNNVYFGKEYGCELCEILFHYNQECYVATPEQLSLPQNDEVSRFLKCIGVADEPKQEQKSEQYIITNENSKYIDYAIKNFPFNRTKLYGKYKSYNEIPGYTPTSFSVNTIVGLDHILENNTTENILYWIYSSGIKKFDATPSSNIQIDISRTKYFCDIKSDEMPSYILWRLSNYPWLNTKSGIKVKPSNCCVSKNLTDINCSPLIEIPDIKYNAEIFKQKGITKKAIDDILINIGVKRSITDFDSETIYELLLKMPEADPQGKFAGTIYLQLAEHYKFADIDPKGKFYKQFTRFYEPNGVLLSRKGTETRYIGINDTFFITSECKYPQQILNDFWIIELPKRYPAERIRNFFNIESLPQINFEVNKYSTHHIQEEFRTILENLKPILYAFFVDKDETDKYLKILKSIRIIVCSQISAKYSYEDCPLKEFSMTNYEYIFSKNVYYVKLEDNLGKTLDLHETFSGIVCTALKESTSFSDTFCRLFEHYDNPTDIMTILGKKGFTKENIDSARKRMKISNDPKIIFWSDVLSAKGDYSLNYNKIGSRKLHQTIYEKLNVDIDAFDLHYDDLEKEDNVPILSQLFDKIQLSLEQFNKYSSIKLKFISYYERAWDKLRKDNKEYFAYCLYQKLRQGTEQEKISFFKKLQQYDEINFQFDNDIITDLNNHFLQFIKEELGITISLNKRLNVTELYNEKLSELKKKLITQRTFDEDLLKDLTSSSEQKSLILFECFDHTIEQYNREVSTKDIRTKKDDTSKISLSSANTTFEKKKIRIIEGNTKAPECHDSTHKQKLTEALPKRPSSKNTVPTNKQEIGRIGESLAFELLKEKYGNDNVIWESNNAKESGKNVTGSDFNHYDMRYRNENGDWIYVEVKTSTENTTSFELTRSEFEFGSEKGKFYEILHIRSISTDNPTFTFFKPFEEDFFRSKKFVSIINGYTIKYEEQ